MNNNLPTSTRKPGAYVGYNTTLANRNLPANPQRLLLIGQRLTGAGSVAALLPTAVFSDADAAAYFGAGSQLHLMCRAAIKANQSLDLTAIAVADSNAGTSAAYTVTITGPATGSGTLTVWVGMKYVQVGISSGDAANTIAANLNTALGNVADLAATASVANGVVTVAAKNKGTCGNSLLITATCTAAGVAAAIAQLVNGAGDPDITAALGVVFAARYHLIASGLNDTANLGVLKTHIDSASGKIEQRGCRGYFGFTGTLAAAITLAGSFNFERFSCIFSRGNRASTWEIAAAYAAYRASFDDPAMPLDGEIIPGLTVPPTQSDWLSRTEEESCLANGITPMYVGQDNQLHITRAVTTYMTAADGTPDATLLDDNPIPILDYVRDVVRAIPRPKKATEKRAAGYRDLIYTQLKKLETAEILQKIDQYKDQLQVIANPEDREPGWFRVIVPAPYVPGLHIVDATLELYV